MGGNSGSMKVLSALFAHLKRRLNRFNIESRTQRYLSKRQKPVNAPGYESTMSKVDQLMKEKPHIGSIVKEKNETLLKNLESVYVKSFGDNLDSFGNKRVDASMEKRCVGYLDDEGEELPTTNRANQEIGVQMKVKGKYTLKEAVTMLRLHQKQPEKFSVDILSKVHHIPQDALEKITEHVKVFTVHAPPAEKRKQPFMAQITHELVPKNFITGFGDGEEKMMEMKRFSDFLDRYYGKSTPQLPEDKMIPDEPRAATHRKLLELERQERLELERQERLELEERKKKKRPSISSESTVPPDRIQAPAHLELDQDQQAKEEPKREQKYSDSSKS